MVEEELGEAGGQGTADTGLSGQREEQDASKRSRKVQQCACGASAHSSPPGDPAG